MHKIKGSEYIKFFGNDTDINRDELYVSDKSDPENIPKRKDDSNKGDFGKVLVVAGSERMGGAALLSAEAALRSGAGIVKVFTHKDNKTPLLTRLPEAIPLCDGKPDTLKEESEKADSVVLGPGLTTDDNAVNTVALVLDNVKCPLIVDADGLNIISARFKNKVFDEGREVVFTPHIKEAAGLLGKEPSLIKENRLTAVKEIAKRFNVTAVLKDHDTFISNGQRIIINAGANSGMATAGAGDVLSGILGGLAARGLKGDKLAVAGVYLHGCAGHVAAEKLGKSFMLASDIVKALSDVLKCHEL